MCDTLIPYVRTLELGQIFFLRCPAFLPIKEIDLKETVCPRHACCIFTPMTTASIIVDEQIELRLIDGQETEILFRLFESNREYLRRWHPWIDTLQSVADVEQLIANWQQQQVNGGGNYNGIWFKGNLCGMINYISVDWSNQWASLSYWLDENHQGQGIMTACCDAMISQAFDAWEFNRISIECAAENRRSRSIPERLGFELEGLIRGVEWLHDHYADHAMYGLLRSTYAGTRPTRPSAATSPNLPWSKRTSMAGITYWNEPATEPHCKQPTLLKSRLRTASAICCTGPMR